MSVTAAVIKIMCRVTAAGLEETARILRETGDDFDLYLKRMDRLSSRD